VDGLRRRRRFDADGPVHSDAASDDRDTSANVHGLYRMGMDRRRLARQWWRRAVMR